MDVPLAWRARLGLLLCVGAWALVACMERLYALQYLEAPVWKARARANTIFVAPMPPPRGRIVDDRGRIMATSEPQYAVTVTRAQLRDPTATVQALAAALGEDAAHIHRLLHKKPPYEETVVARSLDNGQLARVAALVGRRPGVQLRIRPQRRYPYGDLASHVLGYVGEISEAQYAATRRQGYRSDDVVGQSGLEYTYEKALHGRTGTQNVFVDAMGQSVSVEDGLEPRPGAELQLSLDMDLQRHAEQVLQKTLDRLTTQNGETTAGAVVMLDPRDGRVKALVSRPNYDPRLFARGISDKDYARLMQDPLHPLLSRAYQASYPPGSTFKVINASASLQSGICTPQSVFYCGGSYKGFNCFVRSGHGSINFTEAIAQSCDVTFYMLGDHLGIGRLDHYGAAFGLGRPTGIDLPDEQGGLLATPAWKKKVYHDDWYEGDTINMAIGQGLLTVTPLQMATAVAAIANGGKVFHPHLVDRIVSLNHRVLWTYQPRPARRLPVRPAWLAAVRRGMEGVVDHGTATAAKSSLLQICGKTGTAEATPTIDNPNGRNHTWFVSYAPADHPQIVTVVLVVKAGGFGGGVAAPIAKDVIEYWWTHRNSNPEVGISK